MKNLLFILCLLSSGLVFAQKEITVSDIYEKGTFRQESVYNVNWMNDGKYYSALDDSKVQKINVENGEVVETLVNGEELDPQLNIRSYSFSKDEKKLLLATDVNYIYRRSFTAQYYVYNLEEQSLKPLSENPQMFATFSPDAKKVAYVFENNIYIFDLESGNTTQVTSDGKLNEIINGGSDWVYEEEFYVTKTFFWSPNSKKTGFLHHG